VISQPAHSDILHDLFGWVGIGEPDPPAVVFHPEDPPVVKRKSVKKTPVKKKPVATGKTAPNSVKHFPMKIAKIEEALAHMNTIEQTLDHLRDCRYHGESKIDLAIRKMRLEKLEAELGIANGEHFNGKKIQLRLADVGREMEKVKSVLNSTPMSGSPPQAGNLKNTKKEMSFCDRETQRQMTSIEMRLKEIGTCGVEMVTKEDIASRQENLAKVRHDLQFAKGAHFDKHEIQMANDTVNQLEVRLYEHEQDLAKSGTHHRKFCDTAKREDHPIHQNAGSHVRSIRRVY